MILMNIYISIYLLDKFNIPSVFKMTKNIDTTIWISGIIEAVAAVFSTAVGAFVVVWSTMYQINKNNEGNYKRDRDNLRIQNMPIIKYILNTEDSVPVKLENFIETIYKDSNSVYRLNIKLKNVGLNSIKGLNIEFESDIFEDLRYKVIGNDSLIILEKKDEYVINKNIYLESSEKQYKIMMIVKYQDILGNKYEQYVDIWYEATKISDSNGKIGYVNYLVKPEKYEEK